jgi:hypothetical protein
MHRFTLLALLTLLILLLTACTAPPPFADAGMRTNILGTCVPIINTASYLSAEEKAEGRMTQLWVAAYPYTKNG